MVIRVGGGIQGIANYLKTGRKKGRKETRDELDERVVLAGDLTVLDRTVAQLGKKSENYLHITLSFGEEVVPVETLRSIVEDFRKFLLHAYRDDEAWLYAEAHLPRLKAVETSFDSGITVRFPHIHIVVPKLNLLTGKGLNPLGKVARQIPFIDAFQESVNVRYGLTSPKDHRRAEGQGKAAALERTKGDVFEGSHREMKAELLGQILAQDIRTLQSLRAFLAQRGEVRVRNGDTAKPYLNLKPAGQPKGVNFKEFPFSAEFLAWSLERKRAFLTGTNAEPTLHAPGNPRAVPPGVDQALADWFEWRAKEVKYLNSGNRTLWNRYQTSDLLGKKATLDRLEEAYYAKARGTPLGAASPQSSTLPGSFQRALDRADDDGLIVTHTDSAIGQLVVDEVHVALDTALGRRLPGPERPIPAEVLGELVRLARLSRPQADQLRMVTGQGGAAELYRHLRSELHWLPYQAWGFLRRQGLIDARESFAVPRRAVTAGIREAYLRRKAQLEAMELARVEKERRESQLHMAYVLSRQYLWARTQSQALERTRQTEAEFIGFEALEQTELPRVREPAIADWTCGTTDAGHVEYRRRGEAVIRDEPARVVLKAEDREVIQVSLRLSYLKWGPRFTVRGPEAFLRAVAAEAVRMNLDFDFKNPEMSDYLRDAGSQDSGLEWD